MQNELIRQFVKRMITKIVLFIVMMIIISALMHPVGVVISNELALTQMQNDDLMFVAMNTYDQAKHVIGIVYSCVILWFVYTLVRDTYKFVKNINCTKEKEI